MTGRFDRHREPGKRQRTARPLSVSELEALLALGRRLAEAAAAEAPCEADALIPFGMQVRDVQLDTFPGPSEVARLMFGAFLAAGRAFAHPVNGPEARTACAPALLEAAKAADHFLTLHRTAQAEPWRRQFGED